MGSPVLFEFGLTKVHLFVGPILEIGSKDYGNTTSFREILSGQPYVGVDSEDGDGVDLVLDLTEDFKEIDRKLGRQRFRTVFCLSVLEHCTDPFKMAENVQKLLEPRGVLFVSAPFVWRVHGYPDDYWRFTPSGIRRLFPLIEFDSRNCCLCTTRRNEYYPIDGEMPRSDFDTGKGVRRGQYGPLTARWLRFVWRHDLLPWLAHWPYLYPPIAVNMIGTRQGK